jgi:hypothetical protein
MRLFATAVVAATTLGIMALAQTSASSAQQTSPSASDSSADLSAAEPSHNTRIAALVPSGMSAQEACGGFKSITECAAVLHAAQNCGVAFKDLKSKVTGGEKLAAAIHDLKPGTDAPSEVARAEEQAQADVRSSQR